MFLGDPEKYTQMGELIENHKCKNLKHLNSKLITQPKSHGFNIDILKYGSMVSVGNIQDLLAAADFYNFSFVLYMMPRDEVQECR